MLHRRMLEWNHSCLERIRASDEIFTKCFYNRSENCRNPIVANRHSRNWDCIHQGFIRKVRTGFPRILWYDLLFWFPENDHHNPHLNSDLLNLSCNGHRVGALHVTRSRSRSRREGLFYVSDIMPIRAVYGLLLVSFNFDRGCSRNLWKITLHLLCRGFNEIKVMKCTKQYIYLQVNTVVIWSCISRTFQSIDTPPVFTTV